MPADITGTTVLLQSAGGDPELRFEPGPVFANVVLADEINRAAPRTQSALLEAMQEGTVTTANTPARCPRRSSSSPPRTRSRCTGTYPLPEAELDRFLLKLHFDFPTVDGAERDGRADDRRARRRAGRRRSPTARRSLRMRALVARRCPPPRTSSTTPAGSCSRCSPAARAPPSRAPLRPPRAEPARRPGAGPRRPRRGADRRPPQPRVRGRAGGRAARRCGTGWC